MSSVDKELDRVLTLLRNKIRERGFTQLEVQEALSWGRSYISQLLTKQKSLRVEQVLLILEVIGVDPGEFFGELYHFAGGPAAPRGYDAYGVRRGGERYKRGLYGEEPRAPGAEVERSFAEVSSLLRGMVRLLVQKGLIGDDELKSSVNAERRDLLSDFGRSSGEG